MWERVEIYGELQNSDGDRVYLARNHPVYVAFPVGMAPVGTKVGDWVRVLIDHRRKVLEVRKDG